MTDVLRRFCVVVAVLVMLMGAAVKAATRPIVTGLASWYGKQHEGRKMANGQLFDRFRLTAAHRTFKLGTMLRVCLVRTHLCADVEVTDRGPMISTRAIDLSEAAADAIGLKARGVGRVTIEEIKQEK